MDGVLILLQGLVVLVAIVLGVRQGGIGIGLWGVAGTAVLVFGLQLDPGTPPIPAFFIIISVITASAAMQAAGGIDFLVGVASRIIRKYPSRITYVAPLVSLVFVMGAGTGNIFFALIPVIYETSYRQGIRPERPLAAATVTSALGIICGPVSAAMAVMLTLLPSSFGLPQILAITIPSAVVACLVTSTVQQRIGKELVDDPEFLRRVESGALVPSPRLAAVLAERAGVPVTERASVPVAERASVPVAERGGVLVAERAGSVLVAERASVPVAGNDEVVPGRITGHHVAQDSVPVLDEIKVPPGGARSAYIFLSGVALIMVFGFFQNLRPMITVDDAEERLGMSLTIQFIMFSVALIILVWGRMEPAELMKQSMLWHGFVAAIALFGIAWLADTFISGNQTAIVEPLGRLITAQPLFLAVALFLFGGLTTSQSTTTRVMIPIALAASMSPATITALWLSMVGIWLLPANGTQIAAVAMDETGSTHLTGVPVWHSFTIPMLVCAVSAVGTGLLISMVM